MPSSTLLRADIACIHIPRFAVEAERRRRPDVASRLILIGDAAVFDCSLGAEASGVRPGMRMSEAVGLCHRAVVLAPDAAYYDRLFNELLDALEEVSPEVEAAGLGAAFLSLGGLPVGRQEFAEEVIAGIHRRFGFVASAGVASGKFVARVAASLTRPGAVRVVAPGSEREFLAPLSVEHLPVSEAMHWRLELLGLRTMGEVASLPLGAFQSQFGPEGRRAWELAQGVDGETITPRLREETVVRRLQMPAPAVAIDAILAGLERLVHAAYGDGGRGGRWVRKAVVRAVLEGAGGWELDVPFREALSDPRDAWFVIKNAVVRRPPGRPVEELEVELTGLTTESGKQAAMFESKGKLWRQVREALQQARVQRGRAAVGKVVEVEPWSRIPERRAALVEFDP